MTDLRAGVDEIHGERSSARKGREGSAGEMNGLGEEIADLDGVTQLGANYGETGWREGGDLWGDRTEGVGVKLVTDVTDSESVDRGLVGRDFPRA